MPTFSSEKDFNEYFKRENELCDKYTGDDGAPHFESDADFENLVRKLSIVLYTSESFWCV